MNNQGASNRLNYDECSYKQKLNDSTSPYFYRTYAGAYENCSKCKQDGYVRPFDKNIVDLESELKNINRPNTKCSNLKYNPMLFDKPIPVVLDKNICSVVKNNIPKPTTNGLTNFNNFKCE
jgi:hypothetical protein